MKELVSPLVAETELNVWVTGWQAGRAKELVSLEEVAGRCLGQDVSADRPLPPYDRIMMDGVVVRADDWATGLRVFQMEGTVVAGEARVKGLERGKALEIMTGAACPMPPAEAVVIPVEYLEGGFATDGGLIRVNAEGGLGQALAAVKWIHAQGSDRKKGEVLVEKGRQITPAVMGILASCGLSEVVAKRRVKVAIVSTGDELVEVGEIPQAHQIRRSNDVVMASFVESLGAEVSFLSSVDDERENVVFVFAEARKVADVILFSGGASKGRRDWIPEVVSDAFGEPCFHGVRQRPGKPLGAWTSEEQLVLALPGNPVSVLSCLCRYVGPLLRELTGKAPKASLTLAQPVQAPRGLTMLQAVALNAVGRAEPIMTNTSGDFAGLGELAGFIEVANQAEAGDEVVFYPLG